MSRLRAHPKVDVTASVGRTANAIWAALMLPRLMVCRSVPVGTMLPLGMVKLQRPDVSVAVFRSVACATATLATRVELIAAAMVVRRMFIWRLR